MKNPLRFYTIFTFLYTIALAFLSVAGAQEAKPLAVVVNHTVQPQWTCKFTNAINFPDGPTKAWNAVPNGYMVDSLGNAAVLLEDNSSNVLLWISAKGQLLGTIQIGNGSLIGVSAKAVYAYDNTNGNDTNGNPFLYVKYTLNGKAIVKTPFCSGYDITVGFSSPFPSSGIITGTLDATGINTTSLSFYKY